MHDLDRDFAPIAAAAWIAIEAATRGARWLVAPRLPSARAGA